jgi:thermitase
MGIGSRAIWRLTLGTLIATAPGFAADPDFVGPPRPTPPGSLTAENPMRSPSPSPTAPAELTQSGLVSQQYALQTIRLYEAWAVETGRAEIIVAVIDSGVDSSHVDLRDRMWVNRREILNGIDDDGNGYMDDIYGWDFVEGDNTPQDEADHGTHVAGIIAAAGRYRDGVAGVANVTIMPLRVLDAQRQGVDSNVARAINYAVSMGADVINVSLGGDQPNAALRQACASAEAAGVVVIAAAGNQGASTVLYPAAYDTVLGVAAIDETGVTPGFSNYGYGVKLVAPGVNILSTISGNQYGYRSGTSMATAYVSGVAALLKSRDRSMTAAQVRDALTSTADDLNRQGWDLETGYGRVNAYRALTEAPRSTPAVQPPAVAAAVADTGDLTSAQDIPAAPACGLGVMPFLMTTAAGLLKFRLH